jgi:hypothetical protein
LPFYCSYLIAHGFTFKLRKSSRYPERKLGDLEYAYDIALLADSTEQLNSQLEALRREASKVGLKINEEKTEAMLFNQPYNAQALIEGIALKTVDEFKYLGSHMSSSENDFEHRKNMAIAA